MSVFGTLPDNAEDLTGKRFGSWFVVGYADSIRYSQSTMHRWHGICVSCGNSAVRHGYSLTRKTSRQCLKCYLTQMSKPSIDRLYKRLSNTSDKDACWIWTGARRNGGYGNIRVNGKRLPASRLSWILHNGEIPDGYQVCHKCDNPPCCNPLHLFLGTPRDNVHDMISKGRQATGKAVASHSRLTEDQVREIRRHIASGKGLRHIGRMYGISCSSVIKIRDGITWKHLP